MLQFILITDITMPLFDKESGKQKTYVIQSKGAIRTMTLAQYELIMQDGELALHMIKTHICLN